MISACLEANTHAKKCLVFGQKHNGSDDDRKCEKGEKLDGAGGGDGGPVLIPVSGVQ